MNGQSEQLEALQLLLDMVSTPALSQVVPSSIIAACWNKIVSNSGVEDPEDLTLDLEEFEETESEEELADEQGGEIPTGQPTEETTPVDDSSIAQLPASTGQPAQPQADPAVENVVKVLRAHGIPDKTIAQAIEAVNNGVPPERVASQLERLVSNGRR